MVTQYATYRGYSCALLPDARIAHCRVPVPSNAVEPATAPVLEDMCRACLIELVRNGVLPPGFDPRRRWAYRQRVTRDLRRGTGDWDVESSGSAARRWSDAR